MRKRRVLVASLSALVLIAAVILLLPLTASHESLFDQFRRGFDEKRRAFDQRRRAWEDQRRAEEQARRAAAVTPAQTQTPPAKANP
jgi:hypothetical protein